jgi:hypothetical protein
VTRRGRCFLTANSAPIELEVYIGNVATASYGVWWDGEQLVYESFGPGYRDRRQAETTPSPAQWSRFWRTMESIDVWGWKPRYEPGERFEPGDVIRDGTHWSITVACGGRSVVSSGDGAGPDDVDLDASPSFRGLCEALSRLTGGAEFA